jgi:hypothetical protein
MAKANKQKDLNSSQKKKTFGKTPSWTVDDDIVRKQFKIPKSTCTALKRGLLEDDDFTYEEQFVNAAILDFIKKRKK